MPIKPTDISHKLIRFELGSDSKGLYLQFASRAASAYVLCFSADAPVTRNTIDLSEEELLGLYHGKRIAKGAYRYQSVSYGAVAGVPMFRDFSVHPPEQIQVFAMDYNPFSREVSLYMPEDPGEQIVFAPLRFHVEKRLSGGRMNLMISMIDQGEYADGTLAYQVGDHLPIPVPHEFLGKPISFRMRAQEEVRVTVSESMRGKYREV